MKNDNDLIYYCNKYMKFMKLHDNVFNLLVIKNVCQYLKLSEIAKFRMINKKYGQRIQKQFDNFVLQRSYLSIRKAKTTESILASIKMNAHDISLWFEEACKNNNVEIIRFALKFKNKFNWNRALYITNLYNKLKLSKYIYERTTCDIRYAFCGACVRGNEKRVKYIINNEKKGFKWGFMLSFKCDSTFKFKDYLYKQLSNKELYECFDECIERDLVNVYKFMTRKGLHSYILIEKLCIYESKKILNYIKDLPIYEPAYAFEVACSKNKNMIPYFFKDVQSLGLFEQIIINVCKYDECDILVHILNFGTKIINGCMYNAIVNNNHEIVNILLKYGFKMWNEGLKGAVETSNEKYFHFFTWLGANNYNECLSIASRKGFLHFIVKLIDLGAKNLSEGFYNACEGNQMRIVEYYVNVLKIKNYHIGLTVAHRNGYSDMTTYFYNKGVRYCAHCSKWIKLS